MGFGCLSSSAMTQRAFNVPALPFKSLPLLLLAGCCPAQPPAHPPAVPKDCTAMANANPGAQTSTAPATVERIIEDFENPSGKSGGFWFEFDKHPLGTVAQPNPFKLSPGGSPKSPGNAAHIWGTLGASHAPWSWVQLQVFPNRTKRA